MAEAPGSPSDDQSAVLSEEESPFRHYVPGERPRSDAAFFELLLLRVVSQPAPLNNFEEVWPRAMQTLAGLNIFRLANLSGQEIATATSTIGGEFGARLADKTDSLAAWAEAFWRVRQIYGSFRQYLRSFDNDGLDALLDDLKQRLPGLSPDFLAAYLREVGEKATVAPAARTAQTTGRKGAAAATPAPTTPTRPAAERPAPGSEDKGRKRRRGRGSAAKQPAPATSATAAAPPKPESKQAQTQSTEKAAGRNRRNRRRFFRRKRGRDGSARSETQSSSTASQG
ncbi:MAG: hypothetical protein AB1792_12100 [Candidatus Zixiibacteriota bacterium]